MKKLRLAAALVALLPAAAFAQEGIATYKYTINADGAKPTGTSRTYFSKNAYRMEMETDLSSMRKERPGAPKSWKMVMIQRFSEPDKLYNIDDATRTYSVTDLKQLREDAPQSRDETWTLKRLGSDRVAGLSCEKAVATSSKGSQVEVCIAKDFPVSRTWLSAMNRSQRRSGLWSKTLHDAGLEGLPVRTKFRSQTEATEVEMELVSLERKSVPGSVFEIPAGYKESSPAMMGMTPEQRKQMEDALSKMTPEQRKAYEDATKQRREKQ